METILNMLLRMGFSPAGLAIVALIVTWFFILFYFLPRIQAADQCEKETLEEIKELSQDLKTIINEFNNAHPQIMEVLTKVSTSQSEVKKYFTKIYKNSEFAIDQLSKMNKNINNFVLYTLYKSDKMSKDEMMDLMLKTFFSNDDNDKYHFRFKDIQGGDQ